MNNLQARSPVRRGRYLAAAAASKMLQFTLSGAALAVLAACGGSDETPAVVAPVVPQPIVLATVTAKTPCTSLSGKTLAASAIKIASGKAEITSAILVAAAPAQVTGSGAAAIHNPAVPEFCKVNGTISPIDPAAPLINFQVNLPTAWNQKAAHLGGSGLNGSIPDSLNTHRNAPESQPADVGGPLTKGYIELGSDGGHQGGFDWLLNKEAVQNYAYGEMKKTHDVGVELANLYYAQAPRLMYWFGSSQGGRQALMMAQNYPEDYDGIFSQVPVINLTSLTLRGTVFAQLQTTPETWIPQTKQKLIEDEVLRQCDALDGIADGVISNYEGCNRMFINPLASNQPWSRIRCITGADEGAMCLSDAQIKVLNAMHSDIKFGYDLGFGTPGYAAFGVGPSGQTWLGERNMPTQSYAGGILSQYWKALLKGNLAFPQMTWDPAQAKDQFVATSTALDALNPDLSKFLARGGKLILKTNSGDQTSNYRETIEYYKRVVGKMGQDKVDAFVRFYVAPGQGHSMFNNGVQRGAYGDEIPSQVDMVDYLDKWVAGAQVPADSIMLTQKNALPPFAVTSTRPMCRYPMYPRLTQGDKTQGTNYVCTM
jgi:pimeloyl-ACP methyl ester carboxylesterase